VRVAFLVNELRYGGGQQVAIADAERFARAGARVTLATLYPDQAAPGPPRRLDRSIATVCLGARGPFDLAAAWRAARVFRQRRITVLISTLNDANVFARWIVVASGFRIRLIRREGAVYAAKRRLHRILDIVFDDLCAQIIAASPALRRRLIRVTPWRARRVRVLMNAVEITRSGRRTPGVGTTRLLSVGRLSRQKDPRTLILAIAALRQSGVAVSGELIGDGPLRDELSGLASQYGIAEHVHFRGFVNHTGVLAAYETADILVHTSRAEGCSNVILEGMAAGVAIVASACEGITELIVSDETGVLVPPGDVAQFAAEIARLSRNPALRRRLGDAARTRAEEHFSADARFKVLYELVAEHARLGRSDGQ